MMKKVLPIIVFFVLFIHKSISQSIVQAPYYPMVDWDTSPYRSFKLTGGANPNYNTTFRLLWPKNYDSTMVSNVNYPLVIMLHGGGESALGNARFGTYPNGDPRRYNNDHQLLFHGHEYLKAVNEGVWPGFVLFPQNIYGSWVSADWMLGDVVEIVETLSKTLKIDPNRIFVTGLSAGGQGVWTSLAKYPYLFAAGLSYSGISYPSEDNTTKVAHIPIWYFQGEIDSSPPKSMGDQTIQALRNAGGTPIYTVYPQTGHNTWNKAIREPEFFPFMLGHSKLSIHAYFGKTEFDEGEAVNVKLEISPGFTAYEWRKDAVVIPEATTNTITATSLGSYTVRFRRGDVWTEWSQPLVLKLKNAPVIASHPTNLTKGAGQSASFTVEVSGNDDFTFQWQKDGVNIPGANEKTFTISTVQPSDAGSYRVIVSNAYRSTTSNSATLTVNTDLYAIIDAPVEDAKYRGGQTIAYSGDGADLNGNELDDSAFSWELELHQSSGISSVWTRAGSRNGSFTVPTTGEDSPETFYRLILTVADESGSSKTVTRDILPNLTIVTLASEPAGLEISFDSQSVIAPQSIEVVEGKTKNLAVKSPQILNGTSYKFSNWSQSGDATQTITVPENDITYTAVFVSENMDPVAYIDQPLEGTMYRGGQTITIEGSGTDSKGQPLTESAFSWQLDFHHPNGISSAWTKTNTKKGSYTVPTTGKTSPDEFYRLTLTITDPNGTKKTVTRDLTPYTTNITLATEPAGLKINLDSTTYETPYTFEAVESKARTLTAITPQTLSDKSYKFSNWSQGGSASQTIIIPEEESTYTATFEPENVELTASINSPEEGAKYKGGQTISFTGSGTDSKGAPIKATGFSWELEYNHPSGVSIIFTKTNSDSGSFTIPTTGESSTDEFYRLILTITDPTGLKKTVSKDLFPLTTTVNLATEPTGLKLNLDSITLVTPYSFESVEGKIKTLNVISPQKSEGKTYKFFRWTHGGAASQTINVPGNNVTYTAVFEVEKIDPIVNIDLPGEGTMYHGGETISYSGSAINSLGDTATADVFSWTLELHQPNNVYTIFTKASEKSGSFTVPTTGETSAEEFYRLILTISDPGGTKKTAIRDIYPFTSEINLATEPAGLKIILDSTEIESPYSFEAVEGKVKTLGVDSIQTLNDKIYRFVKWKHGGDASQTFEVPANDFTYTAVFETDTIKDPLGDEDELDEKTGIKLFPNPATNSITVDLDANAGEKLRIEIISPIGKLLISLELVAKKQGMNSFKIDISNLRGSAYIMHVKKREEEYFEHFIVIK